MSSNRYSIEKIVDEYKVAKENVINTINNKLPLNSSKRLEIREFYYILQVLQERLQHLISMAGKNVDQDYVAKLKRLIVAYQAELISIKFVLSLVEAASNKKRVLLAYEYKEIAQKSLANSTLNDDIAKEYFLKLITRSEEVIEKKGELAPVMPSLNKPFTKPVVAKPKQESTIENKVAPIKHEIAVAVNDEINLHRPTIYYGITLLMMIVGGVVGGLVGGPIGVLVGVFGAAALSGGYFTLCEWQRSNEAARYPAPGMTIVSDNHQNDLNPTLKMQKKLASQPSQDTVPNTNHAISESKAAPAPSISISNTGIERTISYPRWIR